MYILVLILIVLYGLIFGSFINAWVSRTSQDASIANGRSKCPNCSHTLAWYDLVPVLSYLALKGRCRYCHKHISTQYPVVEVCTGVLFAVLYVFASPVTMYAWVQLVLLLVISILLVAAYVYDAKYMLLPEKFMVPAIALGIASIGLKAFEYGWDSLVPQLVGLGLVVLAYTAFWYFSRGQWLGAGDIRIVAIMGLLLEPKQLIVALFLSYLVGAVYGVYVLKRSKKKRGVRVPFGPFLIIGLYIGLICGNAIANWYIGFL